MPINQKLDSPFLQLQDYFKKEYCLSVKVFNVVNTLLFIGYKTTSIMRAWFLLAFLYQSASLDVHSNQQLSNYPHLYPIH